MEASHMKSVSCVIAAVLVGASPASTQTEPTPEVFGKWTVLSQMDPITDANRSLASTEDSDKGEWVLGIQCRDERYAIALTPGPSAPDRQHEILGRALQGNKLSGAVTWRVDHGLPAVSEWRVIDDKALDLLTNKPAADSLIAALRVGEEWVVFRFGDQARTYTVIFGLDGAQEAIARLDECRSSVQRG
jgi:hypothetical protein